MTEHRSGLVSSFFIDSVTVASDARASAVQSETAKIGKAEIRTPRRAGPVPQSIGALSHEAADRYSFYISNITGTGNGRRGYG